MGFLRISPLLGALAPWSGLLPNPLVWVTNGFPSDVSFFFITVPQPPVWYTHGFPLDLAAFSCHFQARCLGYLWVSFGCLLF